MACCSLLMLISYSQLCAQSSEMELSGTVLDGEKHEVLGGVSIVNVTTKKTIGLTTDKGAFTVKVKEGEQIRFSFIGFMDNIITVEKNNITVLLQPSSNAIKNDVVVVGYQTRTKETVTGAVSIISGKDLQDVPVANVEQLLQGKVAGMNVQNLTGAPGFSGSVSIRGISQLSISGSGDQAQLASNNPLLVIDNVPIDYDGGVTQSMLQPGAATGPLALIPPEDIQSIEVFKDAQAASLYGSRGANGVIVITTKQGNSPTPVINVNSSVFVNLPPQLRPTWGGSMERDYRLYSILNYSRDEQTVRDLLDSYQFLTDSLNPFYNNSTDWQRYFYQTTMNTNHNVQVSGGNSKLNYKTNLAYQLNQGVLKNTGFEKYSLNMQLNFMPTEKLRVGAQLFGALGQKQRGNGGGLTNNGAGDAFTSSLYPSPSHFIGIPRLEGYENNTDDNSTINLRAYLKVDYEIIHNLRLSSTTSYDYYTDTRDRFKQAFTNSNQTMLYGYIGRRDELNTRNGINYSFNTDPEDMSNGHNFYISAYNEANIRTNNIHIRDVRNGPSDFYWGPRGYSPRFYPGNHYNDADGINDNGTHASMLYHALSWAGVFSYNYKTKYVADLSYRMDGNSDAGVNKRYSSNPAIGLRWNIEKEPWMQKLDWLDYGSLRATYGINNRSTATVLNTLGFYQIYADYNNQAAIGPDFSILPNPYLEPEKSYQFDIGGDVGLLGGRITMTYDTYYKKSYNIVRDFYLPDITGYDKVQVNGGSLVNYGHELVLNFRPFVSKTLEGFQWSISLNGAMNHGVLTGLPGDITLYRQHDETYNQDFMLQVGRNPISNYLYQFEGVFQNISDVPVDPVTGKRIRWQSGGIHYFQAGDPIWTDVNGDYVISSGDDKFIVGNPDPIFTGGISNTVSYKNFSLNIYMSYLADRTLLNNAMAKRLFDLRYPGLDADDLMGNLYNLSLLDIWSVSNPNGTYPGIIDYYHNRESDGYLPDQTLFSEDGSYFKINQITLSYRFQGFRFMKKAGLHALSAYTTLYNVGIFSGYSGPNPETVSRLGRDDINGYPAALSFTVGIRAQF